MKIHCEKCGEDISAECNKAIENYSVGRIVCPHCHQEQKRYISEADLLLYFGVSEAFYVALSLFTSFLFRRWGVKPYPIAGVIVLLFLSYLLSKELSSRIYEKAYFKSEIRNKEFDEDRIAIQRSISWQFMLFFVIMISYLTIEEAKIFFLIAMPLAVIATFLKLHFQLRYEKNK